MPTIVHESENPPLATHAVNQSECIRHAGQPRELRDFPGDIGGPAGDGDDHRNGNEDVEG